MNKLLIAVNYLCSKNDFSKNIREKNKKFILETQIKLGVKFEEPNIEYLKDYDLNFIFVEGGGTENYFLENIKYYKQPIYLIAIDRNNSLPASLEMLTYMNNNGIKGKILHGNTEILKNSIKKNNKYFVYKKIH